MKPIYIDNSTTDMPSLTLTAGSGTAVIKAGLLKLGWTVKFEDVDNHTVVMANKLGNCIKVNHGFNASYLFAMSVNMYRSMSAIDVGHDGWGTVYKDDELVEKYRDTNLRWWQLDYNAGYTTDEREYRIVGDDVSFYFGVNWKVSSPHWHWRFFGHIVPYISGDSHTMAGSFKSDGVGSSYVTTMGQGTPLFGSVNNRNTYGLSGQDFIATRRPPNGTDFVTNLYSYGLLSDYGPDGTEPFSLEEGGKFQLRENFLFSNGVRGRLPGVLYAMHQRPVPDGHTFTYDGRDRKLVYANFRSQIVFDMTGPWHAE